MEKNKELSFSDIENLLDRRYHLKTEDLGVEQLTCILDQLLLETAYPALRAEIAETYSKELESMEEKAQEKLITTILKWYLSGKAYIKSTAMRLMVEGYMEVYKG